MCSPEFITVNIIMLINTYHVALMEEQVDVC